MGVYAMMFPDTVEEFMEEYKMVDREHIYSNGCEYVPIYRMKQWFAHKPQIDLVRCGECKWYEPRHIEENGIECAGRCIWHIGLKTYCDAHDREDSEDRPRIIIFREPTDFCSYGERRADDI